MVFRNATLVVLALAPFVAQAQPSPGSEFTYRCVGNDGKKYYGSTVPQVCQGQVIEQLSPSGMVMRRIDPAGDEKMRAVKEAEAAKKREADAIAKEESRRSRALLATYTSEKDIEEARARALAENEKGITEIEQRIAEIKKRQAAYSKEMEFYQDAAAKPAPDKKDKPAAPAPQAKTSPKPPPKLLEDIRIAEIDLTAQENLLALKKKDVETINAKYDEDKKRFIALTKPTK
jgi:hypothetical protein